MDGKKNDWEGVVLIPFIDADLLLREYEKVTLGRQGQRSTAPPPRGAGWRKEGGNGDKAISRGGLAPGPGV